MVTRVQPQAGNCCQEPSASVFISIPSHSHPRSSPDVLAVPASGLGSPSGSHIAMSASIPQNAGRQRFQLIEGSKMSQSQGPGGVQVSNLGTAYSVPASSGAKGWEQLVLFWSPWEQEGQQV